jgi:hypothetical protein
MTDPGDALEAIDCILNRGGAADDVLEALQERGVSYAAIRFVEDDRLVDGPPRLGHRRLTVVAMTL